MSMGSVSLIGSGPGDPEFLTLKALKSLQKCDVILYDALLQERFKQVFPSLVRAIYVGKRCDKHSYSQSEINHLLIKYAKSGFNTVRLKGGDPLLFGRGYEEIIALEKAGIPYEVIPGVSALNGVSASIGLPLTHRNVSDKVLILQGHNIEDEASFWKCLHDFKGTLVVFMGTKKIQEIAKKLICFGVSRELDLALLESESKVGDKCHFAKLEDVARFGLKKHSSGPGIIYIGEIVTLYLEKKSQINKQSYNYGNRKSWNHFFQSSLNYAVNQF